MAFFFLLPKIAFPFLENLVSRPIFPTAKLVVRMEFDPFLVVEFCQLDPFRWSTGRSAAQPGLGALVFFFSDETQTNQNLY